MVDEFMNKMEGRKINKWFIKKINKQIKNV